MNELTAYQQSGLPAQPDDLAKFILLVPEKVKAMQAEIRAIQKAQLAKEVYDQKKSELDRLRELMLLAYQRMGKITREMPKAAGRPSEKILRANANNFEKPKSKAIQDLGFSKDQVSRMEQMAAHPDIVDEVITESQAGQTEATQSEVLRRIKERENRVIDLGEYRESKCKTDMSRIDRDHENLRQFRRSVAFSGLCEVTDEMLDSVAAVDADLSATVGELEKTIQLLTVIRNKLVERRTQRGKKDFHPGNPGVHLQ